MLNVIKNIVMLPKKFGTTKHFLIELMDTHGNQHLMGRWFLCKSNEVSIAAWLYKFDFLSFQCLVSDRFGPEKS